MGAGIALQAAGNDARIEAVAAEAPFANLQEAAYDYAGLQRWPLLGKTFFAPGAWVLIYRGEHLAGFPASDVSPEKAVAGRPFPLLLICDGADVVLPCRHSEKILRAATGPKELWRVPGAMHTGALGTATDEFRRRVIRFFDEQREKEIDEASRGIRTPGYEHVPDQLRDAGTDAGSLDGRINSAVLCEHPDRDLRIQLRGALEQFQAVYAR
jgi:hypothetical protein